MEVKFTINGKQFTASSSNLPIETSLNTYVRDHAHLRGTKFMCLEGGCGACIVEVKGVHPVTKNYDTWAVNSCLTSIFSCHELDIITIEGIGDKKNGYHKVQKRIVGFNGIQCGYCTPGMVMNMHSLLESKNGDITMEEIENSFGGNICRCTGYRPILDAFKSLASDANDALKSCITDIEDIKICPINGTECAGHCSSNYAKNVTQLTFEDNSKWYKVYKLDDLFDVLHNLGNSTYMLVAGNTGHGVYRRDPNIQVFIDITAVEALRDHVIGSELELGGNISLTETMEIFKNAAKNNMNFEYTKELITHIDLIANVPVRNSGTIAGNLALKHQHSEFPSDMFIIFETVGTKVVIGEKGKTQTVLLQDFLKVDMKKKVILKFILPAINSNKFSLRTYKIMPRAQNAHAYVNAGFLFELDSKSNVKSARICFGGINPEFIHAVETEKLIIGKNLYDNETLKLVVESLKNELKPDWILPDASPEYRTNLAISLFYKTILNLAPQSLLKNDLKSGGTILKRPVSSGIQSFDKNQNNYPLYQAIPRVDGPVQSSGETQYSNDISVLPNELYAAFVLARKVHGKIVDFDLTEALNLKGVRAFYSAKDIPGKNTFTPMKMDNFEDEEVFVSDKVLFNGQPAGVIIAETNQLANYAASLVKIIYSNDKITVPIVTCIQDVLKHNATEHIIEQPMFKTKAKGYGNNTKKTIKGKSYFGPQYHYTMEPQTCVVVPNEDGLRVYSSTQWMSFTQAAISELLKYDMNRIHIEVRRIGGGYGAKLSRENQVACAAALAAYHLNVPVRMILTIEANMEAVGKRNPTYFEYSADVDENGEIQKLTNNYYQDYGCSINEPVIYGTSVFAPSCYNTDHWDYNPTLVTTNTASNTWCRSPGSTEAIGMIEVIMEHIAKDLDIDPLKVRIANMTDGNELKKLIPEFLLSIDFEQRKKEIKLFNTENFWVKRGIAVVPMEYPVHFYSHFPAYVTIYGIDGTVAISHGGIEMGQGITTKVVQVAAKTLGVDINKIIVKPTDTFIGSNSSGSGGSIASESVSYAVLKACEILRDRIKPIRESMPDSKWEDITMACHNKDIDLQTTYLYKAGDLTNYSVFALTACEVEVDLLTGNYLIKRVDIVEDTGESLSPLMDVGQIEGAFIMGLGYWLCETISYDSDGALLNNRTWTYKTPGAKDIPIDFRVNLLQNASNNATILRSKVTGEPPLCIAVVVIFALRNALESSRKSANLSSEWYDVIAPYSSDVIYTLAATNPDNFHM